MYFKCSVLCFQGAASICVCRREAEEFTYEKGNVSFCQKSRNIYSRLSLSLSQRDPLKHFEISVLRHIRFAELRKIPIELPNFTK